MNYDPNLFDTTILEYFFNFVVAAGATLVLGVVAATMASSMRRNYEDSEGEQGPTVD